jgi:hypothetical protein
MKFRGKSLEFQIFSGKISLQFFLKIFSKNFRKIFPGFFKISCPVRKTLPNKFPAPGNPDPQNRPPV